MKNTTLRKYDFKVKAYSSKLSKLSEFVKPIFWNRSQLMGDTLDESYIHLINVIK